MPARRNNVPSRRVGHRVVHMLAAELTGVRKHRWNEERFIVFQTVILQCARHVTSSGVIWRRINCRLDAWEAGDFEMLAEDTTRTCAQYLSTRRGEDTPEHRDKILHRLVLRGKIRSDVRWRGDKGEVFQLGEICPNTGKPVLEVICLNYPDACSLMASNLEAYGGKSPVFVLVDITDKAVASAARHLLGAAGPVGTDLVSLQHWLLQFGTASAGLWNIVG